MPKRKRCGTDPCGNWPPYTELERIQVRNKNTSPTWEDLIRCFNITSDQAWQVRRIMWKLLSQQSDWTPSSTNSDWEWEAGKAAKLWALPAATKQDRFRSHVEDALRGDQAFAFLFEHVKNSNDISWLIQSWVKKEAQAIGVSARRMNGEDALYECYGIDPDEARQEVQTTESEKVPKEEPSPTPERRKKRTKRSQRFGACRIHLRFLPSDEDGFLYAADLLSGRNEGSVDEVALGSLQRAVEPKLEDGVEYMIGIWKDETETELDAITNDDDLRLVLEDQYARDKTGEGLKLVVRVTMPTMVKGEDQSS